MALFCSVSFGVSFAETLHKGMNGDSVLSLQNALVGAGYLARAVDGDYGSTTMKAVEEFQRDKGLRVTGIVDPETMKAVEQAVEKGYRIGGGIIYAQGNRGEEIVSLQNKLIRYGYLVSDADGVFGDDTVRAVKKLQKEHEIPLSGAVDEATWKVLCVEKKQNLEKRDKSIVYTTGDRGKNIEQLQKKLRKLEYLDGEIDGIYGSDTAHAVTNFQIEEGLKDTGSVDQNTLDAMNRRYEIAQKKWILKKGDRGKGVIKLQNLLLLHGYHPGGSDGIYGLDTEEAVRKFQKKQGLSVTGKADQHVWDLLEEPPFFRGGHKKVFQMRSTAYTPYDGGGEGRTALGNYAGKGHVAVDPTIIPLGSFVYVEGYGYAVCDDIGGAIQGHTIDVGVDTLAQAYEWGTRDNVKVYLIE